MAFAPAEDPQVAVAVLVENGGDSEMMQRAERWLHPSHEQ